MKQLFLTALCLFSFTCLSNADDLSLSLRHQVETSENSGRFHTLTKPEIWKGSETALIVCDVWDSHNCYNAVQRVKEMAPRLNEVVQEARKRGVTIIHAPSGCMDFYKDHPARERAKSAPKSKQLPLQITEWCHQIPAEERGTYPIDQADGGCDDTPEEHTAWEKQLVAEGRREQKWPWRRQIDVIKIDDAQDYISDQGDEVWSIMESSGIKNVIIAGVHTNMCVLGRPFGLRQMSKNNKNVVLLRDMTDTMYNPASAPYVSHFTGTDLIVSHIEKYVCPTITSDQIIGGETFRFSKDQRPHVALLIAEDEYETNQTLPNYAIETLGKDFRVSLIFGSDEERNDVLGLEVLKEADALLVSVRRRVLPEAQMKLIKDYEASKKPIIGIRTASHAFSLRNKKPPEGFSDWTTFDPDVFGGSYHGHHKNDLICTVTFNDNHKDHPILVGINVEPYKSRGSLYEVSPLLKGATPLVTGRVPNEDPEPVAWTFIRANGGRSFYTSLGHTSDFEQPQFQELLKNGILWTLNNTEVHP